MTFEEFEDAVFGELSFGDRLANFWDKLLDFICDAGPCLVLIGAAIASVITAVVLIKKFYYPAPVKKEEEPVEEESKAPDIWEDNIWD